MQGFFLGLATGTTCLVYCAPVLIPFMLGEGRPTRHNWLLLAKFLTGRLLGYLLFGLLAWAAGTLVLGDAGVRPWVLGVGYIALAGVMIFYGLVKKPTACVGSVKDLRARLRRWPALLPFGMGFLTGLNLCPPFLLAITGAADTGSLGGSLLFFFTFFLGTSLYMIPLTLVGAFNRSEALQQIGKWAAVLVGAYYIVMGIALLWGTRA